MRSDSILKLLTTGSDRGVGLLSECLNKDWLGEAAAALLAQPKGNIILVTGFHVSGYAETDGPSGAVALAGGLSSLGFTPHIVTDRFGSKVLSWVEDETTFPIHLHTFPLSQSDCELRLYELVSNLEPTLGISVERCGRDNGGVFRNMHGTDISEYTAPLDILFQNAPKGCLTIGIGDGGNEIGMGNLYSFISKRLEINPSVVTCDHLLVSTTSERGAWGLLAELSRRTGLPLLPPVDLIESYLVKVVQNGGVDGVTMNQGSMTIDGRAWMDEKQYLIKLHEYAESIPVK